VTQAVAPDEHVSSVDGYVASPLERASEAAVVEASVSTPLQPGRLGPGSGRSLSRCTPPYGETSRDLECVSPLRWVESVNRVANARQARGRVCRLLQAEQRGLQVHPLSK
jgi:L-aminopeptidase/D-esterase-like protein